MIGSTAMYDAINQGINALNNSNTTNTNDWLICLTDGEDNSSISTNEVTAKKLLNSNINVIMIGVGEDVKTTELEKIAKSTKKGLYIASNSDSKSITEAFGKVIAVIQGQVVLEDI